MDDEVLSKMKSLKLNWAVLKDDSKPIVARRESAENIIKLSEELKDQNGFEPIDLSATQYAEFVPKTYRRPSNANWSEVDFTTLSNYKLLNDEFDKLEAMAVNKVKKRLPSEPDDSQKFGMVHSATFDKLLALYIHINS